MSETGFKYGAENHKFVPISTERRNGNNGGEPEPFSHEFVGHGLFILK